MEKKIGEDPLIVIGNWTASNVKYHEPIRREVRRKVLQRESFKVFIGRVKTSKMCPSCEDGILENFKKIKNPRPFMVEKMPTVTCHELVR